ncbi:MAG: hypothetical protein AUI15_05880 [Actinobacteria bacterium 13_2_20CM_2_66_6]|nr:MAG: hypothetical protein AUI15_05880 [Actinobacteria bacterium 13_2_20CM_2_66_6]
MDAPAKPKTTPGRPHVDLLKRLLTEAKAGNITNVAVAFTTKEGGAAVQASPMSAVTLNHLWRLFDDRVRAAYQEVRARASATRSPTAAMSVTAPKPEVAKAAAVLPRAVRRAVARAQAKQADKAMRAPKPAATN